MFTFDKFALSDIFHHEFCSWNFVASLSYVDFIRGERGRRGIRKLDWIVRKRSAVFDRFSFARTTLRRVEEPMEAWILCTLRTRWTIWMLLSFNPLYLFALSILRYERKFQRRIFWFLGAWIWLVRYFDKWNYCKTGIHKYRNKSFSKFRSSTRHVNSLNVAIIYFREIQLFVSRKKYKVFTLSPDNRYYFNLVEIY